MDPLTRYLETHRERFVEDLKAALRIPSVSAQPEHREDTRRCAEHIAGHLRELGMTRVEVVPTAGHPVLYGECLGGALYEKDFERMAKRAGFVDPRVVSKRSIGISNEEIRERIRNIRFSSVTYRLWKIEGLEDACEDYGHVAVYRGGITESPFRFELDAAHVFEKNRPERVCGNTALMLSRTRLLPYFEITGSFDEHFGLFRQCGSTASPDDEDRSLCC